ncbi:MAG: hypothetical protein Kow0049_19810 [Stanieria sp.]
MRPSNKALSLPAGQLVLPLGVKTLERGRGFSKGIKFSGIKYSNSTGVRVSISASVTLWSRVSKDKGSTVPLRLT